MAFSLTEDIRTLAELQTTPKSVVGQIRQTGRPVVITNKGKADLVLMDAATFERQLKLANLSQLLAQAEDDVAAGRTQPAREFFVELRREQDGGRLRYGANRE